MRPRSSTASRVGRRLLRRERRGTSVRHAERDAKRQIDLHEVIEGLREREIGTPSSSHARPAQAPPAGDPQAFDNAIKEHQYGGTYSCVYPIKVNQQRQLCEEVAILGPSSASGSRRAANRNCSRCSG